MKNRNVLALSAIALAGLLWLPALAQELPGPRPDPAVISKLEAMVEKMDAVKLPFVHVGIDAEGKPYVRMETGATDAQKAQAEAICAKVMAAPDPKPTRCENVTDALVVLRFEPDNMEARELVQKHYDKLKSQSKSQ